MVITKREDVTKQGFCKILRRKLRLWESLLLELIQFQISLSLCKSISEFSGVASSMSGIVTSANGLVAWKADTAYLPLSGRWQGVGLGGTLLTFSAFSMGAYSRWALIRGWALIRINPDGVLGSITLLITLHQFAPTGWFLASEHFSSCSFWICQPIPYFHKFSFSGQRHHFSCLLNNASFSTLNMESFCRTDTKLRWSSFI